MRRQARRVGLTFLALITLVAAVLAGLTWRAVRQERLNRMLMEACKRADDKAAVRLLDQGADPNCREKASAPISLWGMRVDVVTGKRPKEPSNAMTPLAYAAGANAFIPGVTPAENVGLVRALIEHGADVDLVYGRAASSPLYYSVASLRTATSQLLFAHGARANGPDAGNALFMASERPGLVADLLAHGADIDARMTFRGRTPLIAACWACNLRSVKTLLAHHADVNLKDALGNTALEQMLPPGEVPQEQARQIREIIRLLKAAGARP
jgi:ankyrin repeat protein